MADETIDEAVDSERLQALRCIDKKAFKALSATDVQQITLAMESMGIKLQI